MSKTMKDLDEILSSLGGKNPREFKQVEGTYEYGDFTLVIDGVPDDPVSMPVRMKVRLALSRAGYPPRTFDSKVREIAVRDFLARSFAGRASHFSLKTGGTGGRISIDKQANVILETSAVVIGNKIIEVRFAVEPPLHKGRLSGVRSVELFIKRLPQLVKQGLFFDGVEVDKLTEWIEIAEDADFLRNSLSTLGLAAFVADGSLPAGRGKDEKVVPFKSPDDLAVSVDLPNRGSVRGMGIPQGLTVIAGASGSGKSALLRALAFGVYNHIPGDGRELIISAGDAVAVRAEEGRRIESVDISAFVPRLRGVADTTRFSTWSATLFESQVANIAEALEIGTSLLLIDDDTTAAPLLSRDDRMNTLVSQKGRQVNTLRDVLPALRDAHRVSTIIAVGGCGDFFDTADTVILMEDFLPRCVTEEAKVTLPADRAFTEGVAPVRVSLPRKRRSMGRNLEPVRLRRGEKVRPRGTGYVQYGDEFIDMAGVIQLVSPSQARGIARGLALVHRLLDGSHSLADAINQVVKRVDTVGLDVLSNRMMGDLSGFRAQELAAALNRMVQLKVK